MSVRLCVKCELAITDDNPSSVVDENDNELCNGCALCAHDKPLNAPCGKCYLAELLYIVNGIGGFRSKSPEFMRNDRWQVELIFPDMKSSFPFQEKIDHAPLTITNMRDMSDHFSLTVATDSF